MLLMISVLHVTEDEIGLLEESIWLNSNGFSVQSSYELEQAYAKEPLLTVDDESLGISDWMRSTTARTWKVGLFSQQRQWVNIRDKYFSSVW